jgi:hypothetical protein
MTLQVFVLSALSYLFTALPFVVMAMLGLLLPLLAINLYSNFAVGLTVIAITFVVDAMTMGSAGINLGINLFIADLGLIPVLGIALLRLVFAKDFPLRQRAWLWFCLVALASLAAGLITNGSAAGVQARSYFWFIATVLYAMSFPMDSRRVRQALNALVVVAMLLFALTGYRWLVYYTPIPELLPDGGVYNVDGAIRVIQSKDALVLAEAVICGLFFSAIGLSLRTAQLLSPLLLGWVLALQHRSVWLCALLAVLVRFVIVRSRSASSASQLALLIGIVAITVIPLLASDKLAGVTQQVEFSAQRALEGADTTGERLNNWKAVIQQWSEGGPKSIAVGMGFGGDSSRYVENNGSFGVHKATYFAHNMYVQTLYNMGALGLAALLMTFSFAVKGLYRLNRHDEDINAQVLLVINAMQLAYYVPYGTDYLQGLFLGVSLSYVATRLAKPPAVFMTRASALS